MVVIRNKYEQRLRYLYEYRHLSQKCIHKASLLSKMDYAGF